MLDSDLKPPDCIQIRYFTEQNSAIDQDESIPLLNGTKAGEKKKKDRHL